MKSNTEISEMLDGLNELGDRILNRLPPTKESREEAMKTIASVAPSLIGTIRRFGPDGPVYEIFGRSANDLPDGDVLMRVRVLDTGEELEHKMSDVLDDPVELKSSIGLILHNS